MPRRWRAQHSRRPTAWGRSHVLCRRIPLPWLHLCHYLPPSDEPRDSGAGSRRHWGSSRRRPLGHGAGVCYSDAAVRTLCRGHHHRRAHGISARNHGRHSRRKSSHPLSAGAGGSQRYLYAFPGGGLSRYGADVDRHRRGDRAGGCGQELGALTRIAALFGGMHAGRLRLARVRRVLVADLWRGHRLCL